MIKENKKGGFKKHNGINERSNFLWLFWLIDGGGKCLLKSYSYRSSGVN